jgi:hypothetical protein
VAVGHASTDDGTGRPQDEPAEPKPDHDRVQPAQGEDNWFRLGPWLAVARKELVYLRLALDRKHQKGSFQF